MNRRNTIAGLAALGAAPLIARAQPAKPGSSWRIGVLRPGPDDVVWRENFAPFRQVMRESGFIEGTNLSIEYRLRPGTADELLESARDLVRAKVDAIVAIAPAGVGAASKATSTIPILANDMESDPVAQKLAVSLARPGGNVTGMFLDFPELGGKWLQMLRELVPKLSRAAVLWDPAIGPYLLQGAEAAGKAFQVQMHRVEARGQADIAGAIAAAAAQKAQVLLVLSSPTIFSARSEIVQLSLKHRLPTIMPFPGFADAGGLMAYGPHLPSMFRETGLIMVKVLQGALPRDTPIQRPTRFEMVVNLKTAKQLGVSFPQSLLLRADRVIE